MRAERLRLPGLDGVAALPGAVRDEIGVPRMGPGTPPWFTRDGVTVSGAVLADVGLQLPTLWPAQAFVLDVRVE